MKDISGNEYGIGDKVVFMRHLWDGIHDLATGFIVNTDDTRVTIRYIETTYLWNKETKQHDITKQEVKEQSVFFKYAVVIEKLEAV